LADADVAREEAANELLLKGACEELDAEAEAAGDPNRRPGPEETRGCLRVLRPCLDENDATSQIYGYTWHRRQQEQDHADPDDH
jgi:hypothetical protein